MKLYHLVFCDPEVSYAGYQEIFDIGVFDTYDAAAAAADHYTRSVSGFRDYPCTHVIREKDLHGRASRGDTVYCVQGWNLNEKQDEIDLVESDYYADLADAERVLAEMQKKYTRAEWLIINDQIDRRQWREGFYRR